MKVERLARVLRAAVERAKRNAADPILVEADRYCVPVEVGGVSPAESEEALSAVRSDGVLMDGIRKIREYGPGKWVVEPYRGGRP